MTTTSAIHRSKDAQEDAVTTLLEERTEAMESRQQARKRTETGHATPDGTDP